MSENTADGAKPQSSWARAAAQVEERKRKRAEASAAKSHEAFHWEDGWPMMQLTKRETKLVSQHLARDEVVVASVMAPVGDAFMATDRKMLIVKTGINGRVTTFDYHSVTGVEIQTGSIYGEMALLSPSFSAAPAGVDSSILPNVFLFNKAMLPIVNTLAEKIRERVHTPAASAIDPADQLRKLADLHAMGALTDEEFAAKKTELLGKI